MKISTKIHVNLASSRQYILLWATALIGWRNWPAAIVGSYYPIYTSCILGGSDSYPISKELIVNALDTFYIWRWHLFNKMHKSFLVFP